MRLLSFFFASLTLAACSREKPAPKIDPPSPTPTEVTPAPPAPVKPDPVAVKPEDGAVAWLRALGKNDAVALAAASVLPFDVGGMLAHSEGCEKLSTRVNTAAELKTLTTCLTRPDNIISHDAKRVDEPSFTTVELVKVDKLPDASEYTTAMFDGLRSEATWVEVNIAGDGQSLSFLIAVKPDGRVRGAMVEGEPN
jgi:hypothetical protein